MNDIESVKNRIEIFVKINNDFKESLMDSYDFTKFRKKDIDKILEYCFNVSRTIFLCDCLNVNNKDTILNFIFKSEIEYTKIKKILKKISKNDDHNKNISSGAYLGENLINIADYFGSLVYRLNKLNQKSIEIIFANLNGISKENLQYEYYKELDSEYSKSMNSIIKDFNGDNISYKETFDEYYLQLNKKFEEYSFISETNAEKYIKEFNNNMNFTILKNLKKYNKNNLINVSDFEISLIRAMYF